MILLSLLLSLFLNNPRSPENSYLKKITNILRDYNHNGDNNNYLNLRIIKIHS